MIKVTLSSLLFLIIMTAAIHLPACLRRSSRYETELDNHHGSSSSNRFTTLYITNLDPQISQQSLIHMFSGFGNITKSILPNDFRGESRGFAFIEFENEANAQEAFKYMNGKLIGEKILCIERTPKVEEGQDV